LVILNIITVKFGFLEEFDFSDDNVGKRVDVLAKLNDVFSGGVGNKVLNEVGQLVGGGFLGEVVSHLLSDEFDLGSKFIII
jgi:hypothetical protein